MFSKVVHHIGHPNQITRPARPIGVISYIISFRCTSGKDGGDQGLECTKYDRNAEVQLGQEYGPKPKIWRVYERKNKRGVKRNDVALNQA